MWWHWMEEQAWLQSKWKVVEWHGMGMSNHGKEKKSKEYYKEKVSRGKS